MKRVQVNSFSLSEDAISKLQSTADKIGRPRSATLERVLMAMSENSMVRYAKKNPVYPDGQQEGVNNGENTDTSSEGATA
jgi:hypothetical protein